MSGDISDQRLMTIQQTCRYLSVGPATLRRMVTKGQMPKPKEFGGRLVRWDRKEIDEMLDGKPASPATTPTN